MSTIASLATPEAPSGIGIIRISGPDAIGIASRVFRHPAGKSLTEQKGYTALFGHTYDGETMLDETVALVFRAPKSYTGEDVVELSCHGGLYLLKRVLRAVLDAGAVPAAPGEFTKRAFLNGKKDLAEAESVMALVSASGEEARRAALGVLGGSLSREIADCRAVLSRTAAQFAAWVDYPDDEIPELAPGTLRETLVSVKDRLLALEARFDAGKAVMGGVDTAIVGRPNVGKSTLLNVLSGLDRAIVTPIAGTTRDVLTETVHIGNVTLRLSDTAGIRAKTDDLIEAVGIARSKQKIEQATLVLAMLDASEELTEDDRELLELCAPKRCIVLLNKTDCLQQVLTPEIVKAAFPGIPSFVCGKDGRDRIDRGIPPIVEISASQGIGLTALTEALEAVLETADFDPSLPLLTTERQHRALKEALGSLYAAVSGIDFGMTEDAVNVAVVDAIGFLGTLTGETATEAVLDEVFKNFCVGK